ncbi:MAG: TatD family hydrolase [Candidatus Sungbacteria bacterium]|uniref:TatD family hydrolase n=1 Tax=Candidatus Sungiibacteriota bacterium TaxID=2750080 RepID=A0A931SC03_9BACT|nr:TatD family hydrolase [Candidatus Sungbacteria bacterium]
MSAPRLIDTHAHVQFPVFAEDRAEVISRALDVGIWMVNIGTQESSSRDAIKLSEKYSAGVYASVGFHPGHVAPQFHDAWEKESVAEEVFDIAKLRELAQHPKVVGIGECGLDYYRLGDREQVIGSGNEIKLEQKEIFRAQIEIAKDFKKPLIIHCRDAFSDLIEILSPVTHSLLPSPGVIHFFSGTLEDAKALMNLGFYLGFGGVVTFAKAYEKIVREIPLERIVLETDAPYVAPVPYRGKRNEPLYIEATAAKIAEWKEADIAEVKRQTTQNAKDLFGI